jgi:hypothetical protein
VQPKKRYPILAGLFPAKVGDDKTVAWWGRNNHRTDRRTPSRSGNALITASSFALGFDSRSSLAAS